MLMELGEFNIDIPLADETVLLDLSNILFIGKRSIFDEFSLILCSEYKLSYSHDFDNATHQLLLDKFAIVLLDIDNLQDPITIADQVRRSQPITRIMAITSDLKVDSLHTIINLGNINGIIPYPVSMEGLIKMISQQDANYIINKAMISIISQPPSLSRASLLLLDPTLSFADETQPVDFIGVFIVHNSVPKFTRFFERTLAHDELLLAGYLSSISLLGDELFKNKETIKEINFGGISVIQRYYDSLQISFLVKNLTRHNQMKAEERIDRIVNNLFEHHRHSLEAHVLTNEQLASITTIIDELDIEDSIENEKYEKLKFQQQQKHSFQQVIIVLTTENEIGHYLVHSIENQLSDTFLYDVEFINQEEYAVKLLKEENSSVIIVDSRIREEDAMAEFLDYLKEISPSIQIILLTRHDMLSYTELEAINVDDLDFITVFPDTQEKLEVLQTTCTYALDSAWEIKKHLSLRDDWQTLDPTTARALLRENTDSFTEEDLPILHGIQILRNQEELFEQFWEIEGVDFQVDRGMLAGIISSLDSLGSEAFLSKKSILGLDIGGSELIVNHKDNFMMLYYIRNVRPNTSVLIEKELEAISSLYHEIIIEANNIPLHQLKSIFLQIAYKAHNDFTHLLLER